jgi:hypothetical protein
MKSLFKAFSLFFIVLIFNNCSDNRLDVDISDIEVPEVKFKRLDKDLFELTPQNLNSKKEELRSAYGSFYYRYLRGVLKLPDPDSILLFVNNKDIRELSHETQKTFNDHSISEIEKELTDGMKRFKHHFPDRKLPVNFVTYLSGFDHKVYMDSTFGISLDMYLGTENDFYKRLQWPRYQTRKLSKEFMVADAIRGWLIAEFDKGEPVNNLLNHMIFYGKILYATDALLPHVHDSLKIGYTKQHLQYCKEFEKNLWGFFAQENRLYENSLKIIGDFTSEGPFTGAISKDCPPQIANWIGWQIVRAYMKNNEKVTVNELMAEKDAQKILSKSKYRP